MTTALEYAILALAAYYRRNDSSGTLEQGNQIGRFSAVLADAGEDGFFAQQYSAGAEIVISYRGTDEFADRIHGWPVALGGLPSQALQAAQFYQLIAGGIDPDPNIVLTGHSLGGGLAGFVGSIYGVGSVGFDHMPFEWAAENLYVLAHSSVVLDFLGSPHIAVLDPAIRDAYFLGEEPRVPYANHSGRYVFGEFLQGLRLPFSMDPLHSNAFGSPIGGLHSQALLVALLYAEDAKHHDWAHAGQYLYNSFVSEDIASAVGVNLDRVQASLAYTAIPDGGTQAFGDQGLASLFSDADEIGRLYQGGPANPLLDAPEAENALIQIAFQFAADLTQQGSTAPTHGAVVVCDEHETLFVDLNPTRWVTTFTGGQGTIVGASPLIQSLVESAGVPIERWQGGYRGNLPYCRRDRQLRYHR